MPVLGSGSVHLVGRYKTYGQGKKDFQQKYFTILVGITQKFSMSPTALLTSKAQEVCKLLGVDPLVGLSEKDVQERRAKYGLNELQKEPPTPLWKLVLEQFDDMLVKILLLAAVVSFVLAYFENAESEEGLRAYIEPFVILLILILNAIVGVWQESNAEAALEALKEMQSEYARVLRDVKMINELPASELVPGDIVELSVGDKIPADMRVLELKTALLRVEQASLTGESVPVYKSAEPIPDANVELQGKENMLFAGTAIANGHCKAVVTHIGMSTEIGQIQDQIQAAASEEDDTPLKQRIDEFGRMLAQVIFYICAVVWLINYHHFMTWDSDPKTGLPIFSSVQFSLSKCTYYFKIAVALAVAAIPEGLPAVITTCLALGTRKMAKENAIVRKLPSVETLGCTSVICSDKTGTLTTNQMSAVRMVIPGDGTSKELRKFNVSGSTYNPNEGKVEGLHVPDRLIEEYAQICSICSESDIELKAGVFKCHGAPTEAALIVLAEKIGSSQLQSRPPSTEADPTPINTFHKASYKRLALLEFDRMRKSMSVIVKPTQTELANGAVPTQGTNGQGNVLMVKGAAEFVLSRCSQVMFSDGSIQRLDDNYRAQIRAAVDGMATSALRCLAIAKKYDLKELQGYDGSPSHPAHKIIQNPSNYEGIESDLIFMGLAGLQDPPRPEVRRAIDLCKQAGIRVIVITGDNKDTAEAICRGIGVFTQDEGLEGKSMTGRDFVSLPRDEQERILQGKGGRVFSRAEPRHKQDIVRLLKDMGSIAAMTGDGVNDAPALKLADIGIAMGITGTEVAKEASDMVLADDNFSTIVAAVKEGRSIYNNMKAFIRYMISSNIGEVASIFLTAAVGLPEGLIPVQLLWVNLVTDGPPATALGFNPPDVDIMKKPPRKSDEQLITPWVFVRYMIIGMYVGCATVGVFAAWYMFDDFLGLDLSQDGHSTVTWNQLTHWDQCHTWENFTASSYTAGGQTISFDDPCDYFSTGKRKATTLSLSVLVAIEMFNSLNALSEDNSLLQLPPWCNPWLLCAIALSFSLHFLILYIPFLTEVFGIVPLSVNEWLLVLLFSLPVILIDEVLKFIGRNFMNTQRGSDTNHKAKED
eukprot:TRINITY_DN1291_c0_g3_i2.p1 TRINITY_DN1291_c0_g3~~TRINITY_DN1291_c0_g3_i2.p1  ORF type:complete len:1102 (-),score=187.46 TRINITY_DN1291_c0_g3_i2:900-4205(-)